MSKPAKHNDAITELFHRGYTLGMIAQTVGISKAGVQKAVNRLNLQRSRAEALANRKRIILEAFTGRGVPQEQVMTKDESIALVEARKAYFEWRFVNHAMSLREGICFDAGWDAAVRWERENNMTKKELPKRLTEEGLFAYFDQMSDENGRIETTAEWLAGVGMLIVHETEKSSQLSSTQKALRNLYNAVRKSGSVNDPLGMEQAMEEAGRWF